MEPASMIVAPTPSRIGTSQQRISHHLKCSKACAMFSPINWTRRKWRMPSWMLCFRRHLSSATSARSRLRIKFARFRKRRGMQGVERIHPLAFCSLTNRDYERDFPVGQERGLQAHAVDSTGFTVTKRSSPGEESENG